MNSLATNVLASVQSNYEIFGWLMIFGNAAAGLWSFIAHRFEKIRIHALWWFTSMAQVTVFIHLILSAILVNNDRWDSSQFQLLYDSAALLSIGVVYGYRLQLARYLYLIYGFTGMFLMGLGIRSMVLGVS